MVPTYLEELPVIPMTLSNKADHRQLPKPQRPRVPAGTKLVAAKTDSEHFLSRALAEVLKVDHDVPPLFWHSWALFLRSVSHLTFALGSRGYEGASQRTEGVVEKRDIVQKWSPDDWREFDRWIRANAVIGSLLAAGLLVMPLPITMRDSLTAWGSSCSRNAPQCARPRRARRRGGG